LGAAETVVATETVVVMGETAEVAEKVAVKPAVEVMVEVTKEAAVKEAAAVSPVVGWL